MARRRGWQEVLSAKVPANDPWIQRRRRSDDDSTPRQRLQSLLHPPLTPSPAHLIHSQVFLSSRRHFLKHLAIASAHK